MTKLTFWNAEQDKLACHSADYNVLRVSADLFLNTTKTWGLPVILGKFGFHLSSSISPSRDTLNRKRGRREVEDKSLKDTQPV